jgi:hypothetical protein
MTTARVGDPCPQGVATGVGGRGSESGRRSCQKHDTSRWPVSQAHRGDRPLLLADGAVDALAQQAGSTCDFTGTGQCAGHDPGLAGRRGTRHHARYQGVRPPNGLTILSRR